MLNTRCLTLVLALGAIVGAAAGEFSFHNRGATLLTLLTTTAINFQISDEAALRAIAPDIIFRRRAALTNRES